MQPVTLQLVLPLLAIAACGAPSPDVTPDAGGAGFDAAPGLAHVEIHTGADEVLFEAPDGQLLLRVPVLDGVARAEVPPGSMATAGRITEVSGGSTAYAYETATALADGDVLTLVAAPIVAPDLPDIEVTLPAAPDDNIFWAVDGGRDDNQRNPRLVHRAGYHGSTSLGFITPVLTQDSRYGYALIAPDVGAGPTVDLSARPWEPIERVPISIAPAYYPAFYSASFGVMHGGSYHPLGYVPGVDLPRQMPAYVGTTVPGAMQIEGFAGWDYRAAGDEVLITPTPGAPIDLDLRAPPVPQVEVQFTWPRTFALSGDVAAARAGSTLIATLDGPNGSAFTWTIRLRGAELGLTLPLDHTPAGAITMLTVATDCAAPAGWTWRHTDYFKTTR